MQELNRRSFFGAAAAGLISALPVGAAPTDPVRKGGPARMKLSLAAYSYRDYLQAKREPKMDLFEFASRASTYPVDAVELTSYYFPTEITPEYIAKLKRHCYLLGLDISGSPIATEFTVGPGPERDKHIAHCKKWIEIASSLGSPCIRVFAGTLKGGTTMEEGVKNSIECLEICGEHASKYGVLLGLENHGGIVAEADTLLTIVKGVKSDWVGINLDTGNFRTADPYGDMERCAPYAISVQVKTEVQVKGQPKGPADLRREIEILRRVGYRGYVTLEYEAAEEPLKAVPRILEEMSRLL